MIGQYLSNTNEIATVLILSKILELNKALSAAPNKDKASPPPSKLAKSGGVKQKKKVTMWHCLFCLVAAAWFLQPRWVLMVDAFLLVFTEVEQGKCFITKGAMV